MFTLRLIFLVSLLVVTQLTGAAEEIKIDLPVRHFSLANGLRVYVVEDHSSPTFAMRTVFDVGARDEPGGQTGFAHLFEHMLFKGSANVPDGGHFDAVEGIGGYANASTSWDRTDYWNELPSNYLDRILWLESDRLRSLAVTELNFVNQRDAVKEEMARYYNRPYAKSIEQFTSRMFTGTPYGHPIFGSIEDLEACGVEVAQNFFGHYYTPDNAVIVISGDVDFDEVRKKILKYYGDIPKGSGSPAPGLQDSGTGQFRANHRRPAGAPAALRVRLADRGRRSSGPLPPDPAGQPAQCRGYLPPQPKPGGPRSPGPGRG